MKLKATHAIGLLGALAFPSLGFAALNCRPEGPVLPKPSLSSLKSSPALSEAASNLSSILDDAVTGNIKAGWDTSNVSFSLALVSADQSDPGVPLWEYHHLAKANTNGTGDLDRDSQYLIGSISKLISDYVLLQTGVDLDTPVTDLLPRLVDPASLIQWEDVSLRMLADHLSGTPPNYGFSEYYYLKEVFLTYGLPPIKDSAYPPCGVIALNGGCSSDEIIHGMRNSYPVTLPNERPAYSSIAFTLIFMALENITGKSYSQLLEEHISRPLDLHNTFPSPGDDEKAVIPPGESSWGSDYGLNAPGGGLVSSLSDLTKIGHGILSRNICMTETELRGWLKPRSFGGGPYTFVGMPWEIFRPVDLVPNHPHPVTLYGKSGGAMAYRSQIYLADEYGIGIVVLTAGPTEALPLLIGSMLSTFVPAVDEVTRTNAKNAYVRTFKSPHRSRGDGINSTAISASFTQDEDSLILNTLTRGNYNLLTGLIEIWDLTLGMFYTPPSPPIRLFPSDMVEETTLHDGTKVTREVWRLWPAYRPQGESDLPGKNLLDKDCEAWMLTDWVHYGSEPTDRVLFYRDQDGEVVGFEVPFLRSGILKPT